MTTKNKKTLFASLAGILILLVIGGIGCSTMFAEQSKIDRFVAAFGSDVKAVDKHGWTLLHRAVVPCWGGIEVVQFLVEKGADVNAKSTTTGWTALLGAVGNRDIEIIKFLVSKGADVNAASPQGFTPLQLAVAPDNMEIITFLVSAGANVNAASACGHTPLHGATAPTFLADGTILYPDIEIAQFLVSVGADVNAKNNDGKTPLDTAREHGHTVAVEFLTGIR